MGNIILSDEEIERLIKIPKKVTQKPQKEDKLEKQHYRNDMQLVTLDGAEYFSVFFRYHCLFEENFSIGLVYDPSLLKGSIILFRCNGIHGPSRLWQHHGVPHTHRVTAEGLSAGLDVESEIAVVQDYSNFKQAAVFFSKRCNIIDCEYIEKMRQLSLI